MVNFLSFVLVWALSSLLAWAEEETSAQRLENAQKGIASPSWPKKPDNRISPLSGKLVEISQISPRTYQAGKEVVPKDNGLWQKEAGIGGKQVWEGPTGGMWEQARWNQARTWSGGETVNHQYQPSLDSGTNRILAQPQISGSMVDWSSRASSLGAGNEGTLRMYEGRLTHVRQQIWRENQSARDLGRGRREKFTPEDVDKILSQPLEMAQGTVKAQSEGEFPRATAGN